MHTFASAAVALLAVGSASASPGSSISTATREETVELPFDHNVTFTVPLVEQGPTIGGPVTTVLAVLSSIALLLVCCLTMRGALVNWGRFHQRVIRNYRSLGNDDDVELEGAQLAVRLAFEAAVALALPWLAALIGSVWLLTQHSAPPWWLLAAIAAPGVARNSWLERGAVTRELALAAALSKLELLDAVSDGFAIAAAAALPQAAQRRFLASLASLPALQWLLGAGGLAGALAAALAFATAAQAATVVLSTRSTDQCAGAEAAELAGLGALAESIAGGSSEDTNRKTFWLAMARAACESGPQLLLQTSVLMAGGDGALAQPSVLLSVLLSISALAKKTLELTCVSIPLECTLGFVVCHLFKWACVCLLLGSLGLGPLNGLRARLGADSRSNQRARASAAKVLRC